MVFLCFDARNSVEAFWKSLGKCDQFHYRSFYSEITGSLSLIQGASKYGWHRQQGRYCGAGFYCIARSDASETF